MILRCYYLAHSRLSELLRVALTVAVVSIILKLITCNTLLTRLQENA